MKSVESHPDSDIFRSTLVIILILLCISVFFIYTASLSARAEQLARQRVVTDIKLALATMLYDYAVKGKLVELKKFDRENPFVPLAIYRQLPQNYQGTVSTAADIKSPGWYFDLSTDTAIYRSTDKSLPNLLFILDYQTDSVELKAGKPQIQVGHLAFKKV